jgi:membrane protease YdiL (CAAX protease family)
VRAVLLCAVLAAVFALARPAALFALVRARPRVWLAIMLLYPLLSVYPQELVFRTFFFHRYGGLFPTRALRVAASAVAFGYAHVLLHSGTIVALTMVGGALFAATYERSRSLFLVTVEHAVYGCWLLTVGVGGLFHNAVRIVGKV